VFNIFSHCIVHHFFKMRPRSLETVHITGRSLIAVDQLTVTVTLNMAYKNFILLTELSVRWNSDSSYVTSSNSLTR